MLDCEAEIKREFERKGVRRKPFAERQNGRRDWPAEFESPLTYLPVLAGAVGEPDRTECGWLVRT